MQDITLKPTTLRSATAQGLLTLPPETVAMVREKSITKGDVAECARIAGLMGLKKTAELLPHCHQLSVLDASIEVEALDHGIQVSATVRTIAATGVEMEALAAVSVALLCAYDMLKPHAPATAMGIGEIRLTQKRGGKTQFQRKAKRAKAAVIVLSDTVAANKKPDTAGASVRDGLSKAGFDVGIYEILPDEPAPLRARIEQLVEQQISCIITVGGTGLSPRDKTVEALQDLIEVDLPGFMEAARSFGQARTPYALLSRGIAGMAQHSFLATFPGSRRGAEESLAAVLPALVHLIEIQDAQYQHQGGYRT